MSLVDLRVLLLGISIAAAAPLAGELMARRRSTPTKWTAAILAGAFIALLTVLNRGVYTGSGDLISGLGWWTRAWTTALNPMHFDVSDALNILLFMPAGWAWPQVARSTRRAVLCLVVLSFCIETSQALFLAGRADVADLLTNSAGALLGAATWHLQATSGRRATLGDGT